MDTTHLVDHTYLVSLVVIAIVSVISALLHRYSHRVLKEDSPKSQFAIWGTLYCSLLRHRASRLSTLWLVNEGVISHEDPEMGCQDESHDRARGPQRQTGGDDLPRASDQSKPVLPVARSIVNQRVQNV